MKEEEEEEEEKGVGGGERSEEGVRNDERAATEPALATQSLTGLFIVQ